jgi:hypothetical protein
MNFEAVVEERALILDTRKNEFAERIYSTSINIGINGDFAP